MSKSLQGKSILIVDDEVEMCNLMADEFKFAGASVSTAYSGNQALKLINDQKFDAIVSDIRMPDGDGLHLLSEVKKNLAAPPLVLLMTGYSEQSVSDIYHLGAEAIFSKPLDLDQIVMGLVRLLLPDSQRLIQKLERPDEKNIFPLILQNTADLALATSNIHFGRGGMFVEQASSFARVGQWVDFELHILYRADLPILFQGEGICRWIRKNVNLELRSGMGVEFIRLSEDSLKEFIRHEWSRVIPYIPSN